ncbi:MAG TPA: hypothetical protein VHV47_13200 [Opitutaceae bacterium]|nr:hypothetical protein [Opitutaceae bacterium]
MTKPASAAIEVHLPMSATAKIRHSKWNLTGARMATGLARGYAHPALPHHPYGPQA